MVIHITPQDVERVAGLMGKDFSDPERMAVIQCLDSCDVQAGPGSGKTTTVVAKLLIMAEKLRGTNQGICILSHTNAARIEIEKTLGAYTAILFRYPNFIGTIQVFTDLFFAIPAYIEKYGFRPSAINNDIYESISTSNYSRLNYSTKLFLNRNRGGQGEQYFANLSYRFNSLDEIAHFDSSVERSFPANPNTQSYQDAFRLKRGITQLGYLTYHDAFAFAHLYIQRYAHLAEVLSRRFPFVFIDEMQDTDQYQLRLLEIAFGSRTVIQKYGDCNQTIFGHSSENYQSVWVPQPGYQICTSRRLSRSIAGLSKNLGVMPHEIQGNPNQPDLAHTIIMFDSNRIQQVIPFFGSLIDEQGLSQGPFMALGAVGRRNTRDPSYLSISSYWPDFEHYRTQNRANNTFWDNIALAQKSVRQDGNFTVAKDFILDGIVLVLRSQNNRSSSGIPYTPTILVKDIRKSGEQNYFLLRSILLNWCKVLYLDSNLEIPRVLNELQKVLSVIGINLTQHTVSEIQNSYAVIQPPIGLSNFPSINHYYHSDTVDIIIDTIHSAKGQTHQATLLLETYYRFHDLERIKQYIMGQRLRNPGVLVQQRYLPLAYVACTRPTHLLCLAIQRDHIENDERNLLANFGWRLMDI